MPDLLRAVFVLVPLFLLFLGLNIKIIKQDHQAVVERIGGFYKVIGPGFYFTIPMIERIAFTSKTKPQDRHVNVEMATPGHTLNISLTWQVSVTDIKQFYYHAEGSMDELETHMANMIQDRLQPIGAEAFDTLFHELAETMLEIMSKRFQEDGLTCTSMTLEKSMIQ